MCGFSVFELNSHLLDSDAKSLHSKNVSYRGRDEFGLIHNGNLLFLHNRLNIIGGANGKQPYFRDNVLVFNGEIHNFVSLSKKLINNPSNIASDTEFLYYLIEGKQFELLSQIEGFFSFVFFNVLENTIYLGRDYYGEKPIFFNKDLSQIKISSSARAISRLTKTPLLSSFVYAISPRKRLSSNLMFPESQEVFPGSVLSISLTTRSFKLIYEINPPKYIYPKVSTEKIFEKNFDLAVRARLLSDFPICLALSAGLDSNAIAVSMHKQKISIPSYSFVLNDTDFSESLNININNLNYKFNNFKIYESKKNDLGDIYNVIKVLEFPIWDYSFVSYSQFYKSAAENNKVIIEGHGPDELIGGYEDFVMMLATQSLLSLKLKKTRFLLSMYSEIANARVNKNIYYKLLKNLILSIFIERKKSETAYFSFYRKKLTQTLRAFDRISMLHGIESRSPFLSTSCAHIFYNLPSSMRLSNKGLKTIVRNYIEKNFPKFKFLKTKIGFTNSDSQKLHYPFEIIKKYGPSSLFFLSKCFLVIAKLIPSLAFFSFNILNFLSFYSVQSIETDLQ
jgi:asparagine synthase (glutamine-hydrolysing)